MTSEEQTALTQSPHLWSGRNYHARNPLPAAELLRLARDGGLSLRRKIREVYRRALCSLKGHDMVLDRWHRADNLQWMQDGDYEIHLGCRRCPHLIVLPPSFENRDGI